MATILKIYFSSIMIFIPFGLCLIHFNCESGYNFASNHGHATWMSLIHRVSETIIKNRSNSQRINCVRMFVCSWKSVLKIQVRLPIYVIGPKGSIVVVVMVLLLLSDTTRLVHVCVCVCVCLCLTCVHFYTIYAVTCDKVSTYNNVVRPTRRNVPSSLSHPLVGLLCLISFFN